MHRTPFDVDEIFEMAEQIERNGGDFYRRAVEIVTEPEARDFLKHLAVLEVEHEHTFAALRKKVSAVTPEDSIDDREDLAVTYLRALVTGTVFDEALWSIDAGDDVVAILKKALRAEKDSIGFYLGLREMLSDPDDRATVDEIVREEMRHVGMITVQLSKRIALPRADG